jgi:hypothetical protein
MQRFGLRDEQCERTKNSLPGREGHVGGTAADNRLLVDAVLYQYEREFPGVICRRVSATGGSCTSALADGQRAAFRPCFQVVGERF